MMERSDVSFLIKVAAFIFFDGILSASIYDLCLDFSDLSK